MSTCALSTPPKAYGGTELVVAELARELTNIGHRVAVFATGDSTCVGARSCGFAHPIWPRDDHAELRHASSAWERIAAASDEFDVVHVHHPAALPFRRFVGLPTVATIHHDRDEPLTAHYAAFPDIDFVAISQRQAELCPEVSFRAVIHHGLDVERYVEGEGGERCAFLGRFAAEKAPHLAIEAARRARLPIVLAGTAHPPDREYFRTMVEPRFGADAKWIGEADFARKMELLRGSRCLVFPIRWEEPFGLVMIEAMLVGTPVVAFRCGAAPEVIDEGVTGYLVDSLDELGARIRDTGRLDRATCRARARERWNAARMARQYVAAYRHAIARRNPEDSRHRLLGSSQTLLLHGGEDGTTVVSSAR